MVLELSYAPEWQSASKIGCTAYSPPTIIPVRAA